MKDAVTTSRNDLRAGAMGPCEVPSQGRGPRAGGAAPGAPGSAHAGPRRGQRRRRSPKRAVVALMGLALALAGTSVAAATWYVRPDGGSTVQCSGRVDAPYPGSGQGQPCAWDHPFRALPPGGTPRIAGGDTLRIGSGSYRMGYGAPETEGCQADASFGCTMPPIPSGNGAGSPTRILGDASAARRPELWGTDRAEIVVNLVGSSHVEVAHLEITDHSGCVEFHSGGLACQRDTLPYGPWAAYGLRASDSSNVYLHHLDIHGLAAGGVHAARLRDWTVEDVRIAGNGSVGWDGDLWDERGDSNSGTLTFRRLTVEWNGCGETYPGRQPAGCWGQSAGGYGDGFATGETGGRWIFEDSVIRFNTSDGLDLLYVREPGSSIEIRRTWVESNAGNQIKTFRGPFVLENSVLIGHCGFFEGKPFTHHVDACRAGGNALEVGLTQGGQATITHNTLTSQGDCLVGAESYGPTDGSERIRLRNNILVGQTDFLQPFERTCLTYQETFRADPFDMDYAIVIQVKDDRCPGAHSRCGIAPGIVSTAIDAFNPRLAAGSPAIDTALATGGPSDDIDGHRRDSRPDIGAFEYSAYSRPQVNCFFDWAERSFPGLFAPAGAATRVWESNDYRHYAGTQSYLIRSPASEHLYYLGPVTGQSVVDLGPLPNWLAAAGCR